MSIRTFLSILLILSSAACVDRIFIDIGKSPAFVVVIDGNISNLPGPYTVQLSKAYDIESKSDLKVPVEAKSVVISDNLGNREALSVVYPGLYQTDSTGKGIRGTVGRVYTLTVELPDGRIYESIGDTLLSPGTLDSVYYAFREEKQGEFGKQYGFDFYFDASGGNQPSAHFLWEFTGTFQFITDPKPSNKLGCEMVAGKCNYIPLCTGIRNVGGYTFVEAIFKRVAPCTCCTCWYNLFNSTVILSDDKLLNESKFHNVNIGHVAYDPFIFSHKLYAMISQQGLSNQSYYFWKAIRDQKDAANSLFQPVTGRIPSNFVQRAGPITPVNGLFVASGTSKKMMVITKDDVPAGLPFNREINGDALNTPCTNLFGNATTRRPEFWVD